MASSRRQHIRSQQRLLLASLALAISFICAFFAYHRQFMALDWLHYDQTQLFNRLPDSTEIVIIEIDDRSIEQLGRWPWSRNIHARLIDRLNTASPDLLVFDVLFPDLDTTNPASDRAFANAIARSNNVILALFFEALGPEGMIVESPAHPMFSQAALAQGHIHLASEDDGIVRSVYLKEGVGKAYWPHLSLAALQLIKKQAAAQQLEWPLPGLQNNIEAASNLGISRDYFNLIPMPAADQGIRYFSYSDVLNNKVDLSYFKDKIVFIGATATGLGDILTTPVGRMPGVELNAWIYNALDNERLISEVSDTTTSALTFASIFLALLLLGRLSPRLFLVMSVISITGFALLASLLLLHADLWLRVSSIIIGIMLFFPLWSWLKAESTLHYLKREITLLNSKPSSIGQKDTAPEERKVFLTRMGYIDGATLRPTEAGTQILTQIQSETPVEETTLEPVKKQAEQFWRERIFDGTQNESSVPDIDQGIELVGRTISQLNAAKAKDKQSRMLIEQSLSGLQDAVLIADMAGAIAYTNAQFKRWFPIFDEVANKNGIANHPDSTLLSLLNGLELRSGNSWTQAIRTVYETGELYADEGLFKAEISNDTHCPGILLVQISLVQTSRSMKDTLIITFTDITKLKAAEQARSEALSFLSHDLRSPMVSVLAILEKVKGSDAPVGKDQLKNINLLVRKNLEYAESFLQLSKADAMTDAQLDVCDMHAALDSAHAHALALASSRSLKIIIDRCNKDCWVLAEISLLERAINNLISNAIKFSPDEGTLTLALKKQDEVVEISVKDQGSGIPKEEQARLFERFTRSEKHAGIHGAGLGLNFVATVARKFHGEVKVNSLPGEGSTFSIALPALREDDIF